MSVAICTLRRSGMESLSAASLFKNAAPTAAVVMASAIANVLSIASSMGMTTQNNEVVGRFLFHYYLMIGSRVEGVSCFIKKRP